MAFASTTDIQARLGRPLTETETETAEFLLEGAQTVIEGVVERDEAAIVALKGEVPSVLRFMAVEKAIRAMANPQGLSSQGETLGAYSHNERFNSGANSDLLLSELEERMVRRAVHGSLSGTAEPASLASDEVALGLIAPASYPSMGEFEQEGS